MTRWALALALLNGIDAATTLALIESGKATEWNPIAGSLLELHPFAFVFGKAVLVFACSELLLRANARGAIGYCVGVYSAVVVRSVWGLLA